MSQTKQKSLKEALTNTIVGFIVAYFTNMLVLPFFGIPYEPITYGKITAIYTFISVARNYVIRRWFNK